MEIREFAERILRSPDLEVKLAAIEEPVTDSDRGEAWRVERPARSAEISFAERRTTPAMPSPASMNDPRKRGIAHHIMCNHELQALEVMAFVLCAFPEADGEFRRGMVKVMADEQRHTRMHQERAARLGVPFGSLKVNWHIWRQVERFESVLDYVAGLPLVFENRNLDHTLELEAAFGAAGDERSAAVMRRIHEDEIGHVAFGIEWLRRLKPAGKSDWETYCEHLHWPMKPEKGRGMKFDRTGRLRAGMDVEFVDALEGCVRKSAE